jgi:predicted peptidase
MRPEKFAAFITVAGPGGVWLKSAPQKSVWISFGKNDKIVPYKIQKFSSKQYLKALKQMKTLPNRRRNYLLIKHLKTKKSL